MLGAAAALLVAVMVQVVVPTARVDSASSASSTAAAGQAKSEEGSRRTPGAMRVVAAVPGEPIDVLVDGERVAQDLRFGEVSRSLEVRPGRRTVMIRPAGRRSIVTEDVVRIRPASRVTAAFALDDRGLRQLDTTVEVPERLPRSAAELSLRNLARLPGLTLRVDGEAVVRELAGDETATLSLAPGGHELAVRLDGVEGDVLGPRYVRLPRGTTTQVFVLGSARGGALRLAVQSLAAVPADPAGIADESSGPVTDEDDGSDDGVLPALLLTAAVVAVVGAVAMPALGRGRRGRRGRRERREWQHLRRARWAGGLLGLAAVGGLVIVGGGLAALGALAGPPAMLLPLVALLVPVLVARPVLAPTIVLGAMALGDVDVPGPLPVQLLDLVVLGAVGFVVLGRLAGGLPPLPWVPAMRWAIALVAVAVISAARASDGAAAATQVGVLVLGLLLALTVVSVVHDLDDVRMLLRAVVVVGGLICAVALPGAGDLQPSYGGAVVENRATSIFRDPNELGALAAVVVVLACGLWLVGERRPERVLAGTGGSVALAALVLALSRGAWLGAGVGVVALAVLLPGARRRIGVAALGAGAAAVVLLALAPGSPAKVVEERLGTFAEPSATPDQLRPRAWRLAGELVGAHPVLGVGPGGFASAADRAGRGEVSGAVHAHGLLLTVAAEGGVVGVVLLGGLATSLGAATWRGVRSSPQRTPEEAALLAAPAAALLVFVGQGAVDFTFRNAPLLLLAWMLVGLVWAGVRARAVSPTPTAPTLA